MVPEERNKPVEDMIGMAKAMGTCVVQVGPRAGPNVGERPVSGWRWLGQVRGVPESEIRWGEAIVVLVEGNVDLAAKRGNCNLDVFAPEVDPDDH
jgi:hypothetical protein